MKRFKYQIYYDKLSNCGIRMPQLFEPNGVVAFRFVFTGDNSKNHKPVSILNPSRDLPDELKYSGYALSCYDDEDKAVARYKNLCKINKKMPLILGDALCSGSFVNPDGMVSEIDTNTRHFDFYEYEGFNPEETFTIKRTLI